MNNATKSKHENYRLFRNSWKMSNAATRELMKIYLNSQNAPKHSENLQLDIIENFSSVNFPVAPHAIFLFIHPTFSHVCRSLGLLFVLFSAHPRLKINRNISESIKLIFFVYNKIIFSPHWTQMGFLLLFSSTRVHEIIGGCQLRRRDKKKDLYVFFQKNCLISHWNQAILLPAAN